MLSWACSESGCSGHEMSLHDWGLHEFSRARVDAENREALVLEQMNKFLDERERDVYLMLGNFRGHMTTFGLMGVLSVERDRQPSLFR